MSKRALCAAAAALCLASLILLLTGCERTTSEYDIQTTSVFVTVESNSYCNVVYDRETRVMYSMSRYGNGCGILTLLVNADGTPKLWEAGGDE